MDDRQGHRGSGKYLSLKMGGKEDRGNYKLVNLASVLRKLLEEIIKQSIGKQTSKRQRGDC